MTPKLAHMENKVVYGMGNNNSMVFYCQHLKYNNYHNSNLRALTEFQNFNKVFIHIPQFPANVGLKPASMIIKGVIKT